MCIFTFNPTLATSRMISTPTHISGSNYIQLKWTCPNYRPELYEFKYVCVVKNSSGNLSSRKNIIKTKTQFLNFGSCSAKITDLRPRSICVLNLIAIYNPASSDTGIVIIVTTSMLPLISCWWLTGLDIPIAFILDSNEIILKK